MFKNILFNLQDKEYASFNQMLIPNISKDKVIGVRKPLLHKLSKDIYKNNKEEILPFLNTLPHEYLEENLLHCYLLEFETDTKNLEKFVPYMDNWAITDAFSQNFFKKFEDKIYELALGYMESDKTYVVRFGIVSLLSLEKFEKEDIQKVCKIKSNEYYINMAIAWYMSIALVKNYTVAISFIENNILDTWVHNKSIQKAIESLRIDTHTKEYLKTLKRR